MVPVFGTDICMCAVAILFFMPFTFVSIIQSNMEKIALSLNCFFIADKISDALGDSLLSAMNFTAGEGESEAMSTDVNDASTLFV